MTLNSLFSENTLALGYYAGGGNGIYLLIFIGTLLLSGITYLLLHSAYGRYSKVPASSGMTGADVARRILEVNGIRDVSVNMISGKLSDHYDPVNRQLNLSQETYEGRSVASLGIAAHECGHAIQHQQAYAPLQWRMAAVSATQIASSALYWIPLLGMFGFMRWSLIVPIMAICFGVLMVFQLITLPVEFDATRRAKRIIPDIGAVAAGDETRGMNKVLNAAALTYVAAFISTLAYFLYYIWQMQNRRD